MGDPISLIFVYGNYFKDKIVDPERYGYIDVVYDAYFMVLKDIPDGKTVNFSVKCFVFRVEVSKEFSIDYTVNGYHKSLMQMSSQTLVEKRNFNNKKNVSNKTLCKKTVTKKTLCKKTVSTSIVQRFVITGVSNNIGDISNSSVTIHGCSRDYVQRRRELTPGASSSIADTQLVNLSSDEDCDSGDQFVDEQVGDEAVGDETVRDEAVRDEDIGDEEMRDDDSVDSEWGKDGIEVGDDDSTNSEKDLENNEDMGGVVDSDGKLSDCKSNDSPDEIDYWVERNIDQTEKDSLPPDHHSSLSEAAYEGVTTSICRKDSKVENHFGFSSCSSIALTTEKLLKNSTTTDLPCKTTPDLQSQLLGGLPCLDDLSILTSSRKSPSKPRNSPNPSIAHTPIHVR
ncbi:hypothetical protein NE237_024928 [Protea cynaroides]|uniref:Uncharacterized protein n=1 Tax=Protea cynaroides TaxID=273540 RepID=A0A9Q0H0Y3_9MAGN|nr:hypothetical protein NE237_024928 [Protea cynaroides]